MTPSKESLSKLWLYFRSSDAYWKPTDPSGSLALDYGDLGPYPLDIRPRLDDGHYGLFDSEGVPMRRCAGGKLVYLTTTMSSCALARWHRFVETGNEEFLVLMLAVANRLAATPLVGGELQLVDKEDSGRLCAMNQGEAMSVLVRAWKATGVTRYLDAASACLGPFLRSVDDRGVVGEFGEGRSPWYEESVSRPLRHILNGMVYAVWGLRDLAVATSDTSVSKLADRGVRSVRDEVWRFDLGWWSRYWVPDLGAVEYIASVMYQALHVAQLRALGRQYHDSGLVERANRFRKQVASPLGRLRAGFALATAKQRLKRGSAVGE